MIEGRWELNQLVIELHKLPKADEILVQTLEIPVDKFDQFKLGLWDDNQPIIEDHKLPNAVEIEVHILEIVFHKPAQLIEGK